MPEPFSSLRNGNRWGPMSVGRVLLILTILLTVGLWWLFSSATQDSGSLYVAALKAIDESDFRSARDIIGQLEKLPGEKSRVRILRGRLNLRVNLPGEAIDELQPLVTDEAFRVQALTMQGEAFYALGRHPESERVLQDALALDPSNTEARRWLAASYYDIGAMDLAMEQLATVSGQAPHDPRPNRLRGLIQKDFKRYQEAIEDYSEALRRVPSETVRQEILLELAECQVEQHLYDDAEKALSEANVTAGSLVLQARCAQARDRSDTAISLVERALQLEPGHLNALLFQAETLTDRNDLDQAAGVLEKAVAAWPREYQPRYQLSNVLRRLGREEEAETQSAEMQRLQNLSDQFTTLHEQAFADTGNAEIRFQLGELCIALDKLDLAAVWFKAALGIAPGHAGAREALSRLRTRNADAPH